MAQNETLFLLSLSLPLFVWVVYFNDRFVTSRFLDVLPFGRHVPDRGIVVADGLSIRAPFVRLKI